VPNRRETSEAPRERRTVTISYSLADVAHSTALARRRRLLRKSFAGPVSISTVILCDGPDCQGVAHTKLVFQRQAFFKFLDIVQFVKLTCGLKSLGSPQDLIGARRKIFSKTGPRETHHARIVDIPLLVLDKAGRGLGVRYAGTCK